MSTMPAAQDRGTIDVRDRLALALDVDDLDAARSLARQLQPWFGVAKVGLELFSVAGPDAVGALVDLGYRVFLDVKLHDIPTTVGRAARVLGRTGVSLLTLHTTGGVAMVAAGVEGLGEGACAAGHPPPVALGVTVLTSDEDAPTDLLRARVGVAVEAGCGGLVCAAADLAVVKGAAPELLTVVPGIRLERSNHDDQARAATPGAAIGGGADLLVVGRTVTAAADPVEAAQAVTAAVADGLGRGRPAPSR